MLVTRDGLIVKVLDPDRGQKWLRCIFDGLCGCLMQHHVDRT